ncbi:MAG: hypothetical protein QNJ98_01130 [Planctomycetota bacterium]|nr:hypothetical protein [Planctomycetota bacterium]
MGRRKAEPPPGYARRFLDVLQSPLGHVLLRVTGVALLLLVGGLVMRQARAQAYEMPAYRLTPSTLAFVKLPSWADAHIQKELASERYYRRFSSSVFDPDAEAHVRAVVTSHPLVKTVRTVDIVYPKSVTVHPVLRAPVAIVSVRVKDRRGRLTHRKRLLADDGSLLPTDPYKGYLKGLKAPLPVIHGIRAAGTARVGLVWEDRHGQVAEAVAAADVARRLYRDTRGRVHVRVIDVGRFPSLDGGVTEGEISFQATIYPTRRGGKKRPVRLEWGRTERDCRDAPLEDCYQKKLARLERALKPHRALTRSIDVRFPDDVD